MVQSWEASDGSLHKTEDQAKEKDWTIAFGAWLSSHFPDNYDMPVFERTFDNLVTRIRDDRMALMKVMKLLNGGAGIPPVAAIKQPSES